MHAGMKLRTYLRRNDLTPREFAERCRCSKRTIYNVLNGTHRTRLDIAMRISRETRGKVSLRELLDECGEQDEKESAAA